MCKYCTLAQTDLCRIMMLQVGEPDTFDIHLSSVFTTVPIEAGSMATLLSPLFLLRSLVGSDVFHLDHNNTVTLPIWVAMSRKSCPGPLELSCAIWLCIHPRKEIKPVKNLEIFTINPFNPSPSVLTYPLAWAPQEKCIRSPKTTVIYWNF